MNFKQLENRMYYAANNIMFIENIIMLMTVVIGGY